jgi:hypothetical protein
MIIARSSRKSVTPSAGETYHEEGEEAGEEEEAEEPARPTKRQRTSSRAATGQAQGKGKDKGKARAPKPITPSPRFPPAVRKTRGKSKKAELSPYIPSRAVPTMDTVRLAAESLAKEQREPTVVSEVNRDCPSPLISF